MNPHDPLIEMLTAHADRAARRPSGRVLVPVGDLRIAANALRSLSERVAELESAALDAAGSWGGGAIDTGAPEVVTLPPRTDLDAIEARLAALEARERGEAPADPPAGVAEGETVPPPPQPVHCTCGARQPWIEGHWATCPMYAANRTGGP